MTLVFVGHSFKYELEAVTKLFFPVESFEFQSFDSSAQVPEISGDRCIITRNCYSGIAELTADSRIGGIQKTASEKISIAGADYEKRCEYGLGRVLFISLRELCGINPGWGMLTGVRPVKLITRLLKSGKSEREVCDFMEKNLYVSPEKVRLGIQTAQNQKEILDKQPKRSVSLYVSIPFCPSRCAYCSFVSQTVSGFYRLIPEYVDRLCDELRMTGRLLEGVPVDTVYFGGGTPTSLEAEQLEKITQAIASNFDISSLREYTVEAGRPDTVTLKKLETIKENGCTRISVNPQTMHDFVLEAVGRKHTVKQFLEAYELAKSVGFDVINIDLIAGLPTDTLEKFTESVSRVIALNPQNITVHVLSIKRSADMMHAENLTLPVSEISDMVSTANALLSGAGYRPYYLYRQKNQLENLENVGWQRDNNAGVYNINMMEETQTVIAAGAGAASKIVVDPTKIERFYNPKYPVEYLKRFNETVLARKKELCEKLKYTNFM